MDLSRKGNLVTGKGMTYEPLGLEEDAVDAGFRETVKCFQCTEI